LKDLNDSDRLLSQASARCNLNRVSKSMSKQASNQFRLNACNWLVTSLVTVRRLVLSKHQS